MAMVHGLMVAIQTPSPRQRGPSGTPIQTSVGSARVLPLADGRWAVVSDTDLFSSGVGDTPAEALADFEQRVGQR